MSRRVIRDMRQPARREETWTLGDQTFRLTVQWSATAERWSATVRVVPPAGEPLTLPLHLAIELDAAGEALLYSTVSLQDLKRLTEDALLDLARGYLRQRQHAS